MKPTTLIIALLLLLPSGCAQVSPPEQNLAQRLNYTTEIGHKYRLDPDWWKIYQDENLNRLMAQALANNTDLAKAAVSVNRALHQARLIKADLTPSFSGGLEASARRNLDSGGPSVPSAGANLSLSYELDLWRKVADSASAQEWEYRATQEDREATRLALTGSVTDAYYRLAYLNDAILVAQANLKNCQAIERATLVKFQAGKVAAVELAQARQTVLNAENSLIDYQNQRKTGEQTLRDLLNLKPGGAWVLNDPTLKNLQLTEVDLTVPLAVLANRPDLKAAEYRLNRAFKNVQVAEKAWLPSISLKAALNYAGAGLGRMFENPTANGSAVVDLPFLDWSTVINNLRISEADFESLRLDFEKALTTALNEVDAYYYLYEQSQQTLSLTRQKYTYDQQIAVYYQDRYQAGAGELADWLSALNTANSSRLAALNALYQTIQYQNQIYKALTGLYRGQTAPGPAAT